MEFGFNFIFIIESLEYFLELIVVDLLIIDVIEIEKLWNFLFKKISKNWIMKIDIDLIYCVKVIVDGIIIGYKLINFIVVDEVNKVFLLDLLN